MRARNTRNCYSAGFEEAVAGSPPLIAVRKRFTKRRLALGLLFAHLACMAIGCGMIFFCMGVDLYETSPVFGLAPLPYLIGFFLFATLNSWCREGIIRVFGLGLGTEDPDVDIKQETCEKV